MTAKNDPFYSIRSAIQKGVQIECRLAVDNLSRHIYPRTAPSYYWNDPEHSRYVLSYQLKLADAFNLLTWEMVEQNTLSDIRKLAEDEQMNGKVYYQWRARLESFSDADFALPKVERPMLGDQRLVIAQAKRHKFWRDNPHGVRQRICDWRSHPFSEPKEATYIGVRTVYSGIVENPSYDQENPGTFIVARSIEMWKFVSHERKADFYVFPHDTQPMESGREAAVNYLTSAWKFLVLQGEEVLSENADSDRREAKEDVELALAALGESVYG